MYLRIINEQAEINKTPAYIHKVSEIDLKDPVKNMAKHRFLHSDPIKD